MLLKRGIAEDGSSLSGVSAVCSWEDGQGRKAAGTIVTDLPGMGPNVPMVAGIAHGQSGSDTTLELLRTQTLDKVNLLFNYEAAKLIYLALR